MNTVRCVVLGMMLLALSACTQLRTLEVEILHTRLSAAVHRFSSPLPGDSYAWDFGDGNWAEGRTVEHAYAKRGTYTVNLNLYYGVENHHVAIQIEVGAEWTIHGEAHPDGMPSETWKIQDLQLEIAKAEDGDTLWVSGEFGELILDEKEVDIVGDATFVRIIYRGVGGLLSGVTIIGTQDVEREEPRSALILDHADPRIEGCMILGSTVDGYGGGIYAINSAATIVDCLLSENGAGQGGGGAYVYGSSVFPQFLNCTFHRNQAGADGGAILMRTILDEPLSPQATLLRLDGCTFIENRAQATFSAAPVSGGAIHIGFGGRAVIADCSYSGNWPADVVFEDPYRRPE